MKIALTAAAAFLFLSAAPAMSQIHVSPGVDVTVGVGDRGWHRGHYRHRHEYRHGRGDRCREVTVRRRLPDGSVVVRKSRSCR